MDAATLERLRARLVLASCDAENDQGARLPPHARERTRAHANGWNSKHSGETIVCTFRGLS